MINIVSSFLNLKKKISNSVLPSEGYFYNDDFNLYIKRATNKEIDYYKNNINVKSISSIIFLIKKIVKENTLFSKNYLFEDLKSIDIIFIFIEIVKFTMNKKILIKILDKEIEFSEKNFNYFFKNNPEINKYYNKNNKCFSIDGYDLSIPSIGVENSLTIFLVNKIDNEDNKAYSDYFYDFTYFLGSKNNLDETEIENLIQIFNFEVEKSESKKIKKIIEMFLPLQTYKLLVNNKVEEITSRINLLEIWD